MIGFWIIFGALVTTIFGYIIFKNKDIVGFTSEDFRNLKWKLEPRAIYIEKLKRGEITRETYESLVSDKYGLPLN